MALTYPQYQGPDLTLEAVRTWQGDGFDDHVVELVRISGPHRAPPHDLQLLCACDTKATFVDGKDGRAGHWLLHGDPSTCLYRVLVREQVKKETRQLLEATVFAAATSGSPMDLAAVVLWVFRKAEAGEFVGQHHMSAIFATEIAEIIGVSWHEVGAAVAQLRREEKLDTNGDMLFAYRPRFRFPDEIRFMIRMMVETPIGWPCGEAGDIAVAKLEQVIADSGAYAHGKDLVWPHNFPNISADHLLEFASVFCLTVARRHAPDACKAFADGSDKKEVQRARYLRKYLPAYIEQLEDAVAKLRAAAATLTEAIPAEVDDTDADPDNDAPDTDGPSDP